jgi:hypothetical protein
MLPEDDIDGREISPRCDIDGDTARFTPQSLSAPTYEYA